MTSKQLKQTEKEFDEMLSQPAVSGKNFDLSLKEIKETSYRMHKILREEGRFDDEPKKKC